MLYISEVLLAAIVAILFETNLLPSGIVVPNPAQTYTLQMICIIDTIVAIPVALKLLHFKRISALIHASEQSYHFWSTVRLGLLGVVLMQNLIIYYLIGFDTSFGYLALITVVSFLFIWPSQEKMEYERQFTTTQDEA